MNRFALALPILVLLASKSFAQEVSSMQIFMDPPGVEYYVDGERFSKPTVFLWPKGSKHVVIADTHTCQHLFDNNCITRYEFYSWETNAGPIATATATTHVITADPAVTFLKGNFQAHYRVSIASYDQPHVIAPDVCAYSPHGPRPPGGGPGIVYVGGICVPFARALWLAAGDYPLQALPFEGYIFRGWSFDNGVTSAYINSIKIQGPTSIQPLFEPAKRVRLFTSPPGLQLRIDRTVVNTADPRYLVPKYPIPGYFDWMRYSTHLLAGVSPQTSLDGKAWVFDSWSNGGGQDMVYTVDDELNVITELTAKFVRGVAASVMTSPANLKVRVDDRDNFPYTFVWKVGTKVKLIAPAEQTDSRGRKYTFKEWSDGGTATHEVSVEESHLEAGIRVTAVYEAMPQAIIQTSVPGVAVKVDGVDCASPCKLDRATGTTVRVSVPAVLPLSDAVRQEFVGWHDGTSTERTVTFDRDTQTVVANYRKANRLIVTLDPADAAVVSMEPASSDGFYPVDASVRVTLEPKRGFRFRRWDGDLSGTFKSGVVNMANVRVVQGLFDRVPFVSEYGVQNAAGITPETGVAAGSLVSIFGASLANRFEASAAGRLSQTLAGAVVMVEDGIVPLVFASPEQINAQLPSHLQPGNYTLRVRPEGLAELKAEFAVVRNAPGLFANPVESVAYAVATHQDGSPVTIASPARRDETITFTGTGFGPYDRQTVDGFAIAASPVINLVDPIEVRIGEIVLRPDWSGALPGLSGVAGARVKLAGVPSGRLEVKVAVNGVESNTVVLPVE